MEKGTSPFPVPILVGLVESTDGGGAIDDVRLTPTGSAVPLLLPATDGPAANMSGGRASGDNLSVLSDTVAGHREGPQTA
jgi:hypothetical protein